MNQLAGEMLNVLSQLVLEWRWVHWTDVSTELLHPVHQT